MTDEPTPNYHGIIIAHDRITGKVPTRIYYAEIRGRPQPSASEWNPALTEQIRARINTDIQDVLEDNSSKHDLPHIALVFPHVTTLYHPGTRETNWHHQLFTTSPFDPKLHTSSSDPSLCLLAIEVLAAESRHLRSKSIDEFINHFPLPVGYEVRADGQNKISAYRQRNAQERME